MGHATFLYSAVSILLGCSAFTIVLAAYLTTRSLLAGRCLFLQSALSFLAIAGSILAYFEANLPGRGGFLFELIDYLESPLAMYAVLYATIVFVHALFAAHESGKRNIAAGAIIAFAYIAYNVIAYVVPFSASQKALIDRIEDRPVSLAAMAYCMIVGARGLARVRGLRTRRMALLFLISLAVFLPAMVLDAFDLSPLRPFPILFFALSIDFAAYFIRETSAKRTAGEGSDAMRSLSSADTAGLSAREKEIVEMLLGGSSYRRIAEKLFISENTVKTHVRNIYPKFGVNSRFELMNAIEDRNKAATGDREKR